MRTFRDIVRDLDAETPGLDDAALATATLRYLKVNATATETLHSVVSAAVGNVRRVAVRAIERDAFGRGASHIEDSATSHRRLTGEAPVNRIAARAALLDETFIPTPGAKPVKWGEATVEQHCQHMAMLKGLIAGNHRTLEGHAEAVADIEAAGVRCLNEIEGWAA